MVAWAMQGRLTVKGGRRGLNLDGHIKGCCECTHMHANVH